MPINSNTGLIIALKFTLEDLIIILKCSWRDGVNSQSAGIDFRRQNLTSKVDAHNERIKHLQRP